MLVTEVRPWWHLWMLVRDAYVNKSRCWWPKWPKPLPAFWSCHKQRKTHRIIFLVTWYTSEWWFLRFTSKWSIIKQKNRVLSRIFWAGTDFEKSKKKWNHQAPVVLESSKKFFKETDTIPLEHIKTIFHFKFLLIWVNISDNFSCGNINRSETKYLD